MEKEIMKTWIKVFLGLLVTGFVLYHANVSSASKTLVENTGDIDVTILYDNYVFTEGTKADWGFACLIEGTEKTILFDTGTQPDIFWHNIEKLNIDINKVDIIVISHEHGDHTGGLASFLEKKNDVPVYAPVSFSEKFKNGVRQAGAKLVEVSEPLEICKNVLSTGEMGTMVKEQSLVLDTSQGGVVITGCAHPGIADIVKRGVTLLKKEVYFTFGGFHLMQHSPEQVQRIIQQFKEAGIKKCGATHCTGENAIEIFKKVYGDQFVGMGVGKVVKIPF